METLQLTQLRAQFVVLEQVQLLGQQPVHHALQEQALTCKARQPALLALQAPILHRELQHALLVHLDSRVVQLALSVVLLVMLGRLQLEMETLLAVHVLLDIFLHPLGYLNVHHALLELLGQVLDSQCALRVSQWWEFHNTLLQLDSQYAQHVLPVLQQGLIELIVEGVVQGHA